MTTVHVINELNPAFQVEKTPFPAILPSAAGKLYNSNKMEGVWRGRFTEILYLSNSSNHQRKSDLPRYHWAQIGDKYSLVVLDRSIRPLQDKLLTNNLQESDYAARHPAQDSSVDRPEVYG